MHKIFLGASDPPPPPKQVAQTTNTKHTDTNREPP